MWVSGLIPVCAIQEDPCQKETKRRGQEEREAKGRKKKREGRSHLPLLQNWGVFKSGTEQLCKSFGSLMTGLTPSADRTPHRVLPRWVCRSLTPICHSFNSGEIFSISQQSPTCYCWCFSSLKVPRPFVGACVYLRAACFTRSYNRKRVATSIS